MKKNILIVLLCLITVLITTVSIYLNVNSSSSSFSQIQRLIFPAIMKKNGPIFAAHLINTTNCKYIEHSVDPSGAEAEDSYKFLNLGIYNISIYVFLEKYNNFKPFDLTVISALRDASGERRKFYKTEYSQIPYTQTEAELFKTYYQQELNSPNVVLISFVVGIANDDDKNFYLHITSNDTFVKIVPQNTRYALIMNVSRLG